jgi:penicillin-binding protein 1C
MTDAANIESEQQTRPPPRLWRKPGIAESLAAVRRRRITRALATLGIIGLVLAGGLMAAIEVAKHRMGPPPLAAAEGLSTVVLDRNGQLLRAFTTPDGRWRMPLEPGDVDPRYLAMLKAYEDKRFDAHAGVDPLAFARAGYLLVRHGRLLSGGSTLTMQVARLLEGRHEKTAAGKFRQIVRALQLEEKLSKQDILRLYLRLAPFGGNIEGARAASLAYFGKEPKRLSIGEAALLVALPQSPERRRPERHVNAAKKARDYVLDRVHEAGIISKAERDRAKEEKVPAKRHEFPKLAPHLSESEVALDPAKAVHRLTIDRTMQSALEQLAGEQTKLVGEKLSSAILVADNATGEILAYVGSAGYLDHARAGLHVKAAHLRARI